MMENRSVGSIIKEWRKTHKLKLREVTATIKISISALSDIEQGRRQASPKVLMRLSEVVGQDLLGFRKRTYKELKAENARLRAQLDWTPVSQLPTKRGHYWCYIVFEPEVCRRNSRRTWQREAWFDGKNWHSKWGSERIKAWREIPQAWEGNRNENLYTTGS